MVSPVFGPTQEINNQNPVYYRIRYKWRQTMPIDGPLPYESRQARLMGSSATNPETAGNAATIFNFETSSEMADLKSKVFDRLQSQIQDGAALGAALAERHQALAMIATRAGQLRSLVRAIGRYDFRLATAIVRGAFIPPGVSKRKAFASNWLEFSFGWRPLIQDVFSAVDVLQDPFLDHRVKATGKSSYKYYEKTGSPGFEAIRDTVATLTVRTGGLVRITNPNLFLANKLGLVNPATILWEVTPFSFVVDWFANVEQFLSSGTAYLGLTVVKPWSLSASYGEYWREVNNPFWVPPKRFARYAIWHVYRSTAFVKPTLHIRTPYLPSWGRALNAISVLTQQISRR